MERFRDYVARRDESILRKLGGTVVQAGADLAFGPEAGVSGSDVVSYAGSLLSAVKQKRDTMKMMGELRRRCFSGDTASCRKACEYGDKRSCGMIMPRASAAAG